MRLSLVLRVLRGHLAPLDLKGTQESQDPISLDQQDRMGFQGVLDLMDHQENLEDQTSSRVLQAPKGRRASEGFLEKEGSTVRSEIRGRCVISAILTMDSLHLRGHQENQGRMGYQVLLVFLDSKVAKGSKVLQENLVHRVPTGSLVLLGLQDLWVILGS